MKTEAIGTLSAYYHHHDEDDDPDDDFNRLLGPLILLWTVSPASKTGDHCLMLEAIDLAASPSAIPHSSFGACSEVPGE